MNPDMIANQLDLLLSPVPEEKEFISPQHTTQTSHSNFKSHEGTTIRPREIGKLKHGLTLGNRSVYQCKYLGTFSTRKPAPVRIHTNPSAEAVLRERKVEIKDLESNVVYLKNQIKELKVENKTLLDIQSRQEKELRKFKGGVADIPALLRSHKDEIKASESTVASLRRELWDYQKDLKNRSDIVLRKDQHIDKLNVIIKRNEKRLQEISLENKQLKLDKKKLEDDNKKIIGVNEELKSKNDRFQKKMQEMSTEILDAEEKLGAATDLKSMLEGDIIKLQKKYEESLQNGIKLRKLLQPDTRTVNTQTDSTGTCSKACMTTNNLFDYIKTKDKRPRMRDEDSTRTISKACMTANNRFDYITTEGIMASPQNLETDALLNNINILSNAESNIWNQNGAANSITKELKNSLDTSEPFTSISMRNAHQRKEHNCGDNLLAGIASCGSLRRVHHGKILYPKADAGDVYGENGMNKGLVSEAESERKCSCSSNGVHSVRCDRQFADESKKAWETTKPIASFSMKKVKEQNCSGNLLTGIASSSSLQRDYQENNLYPNADEGDAYGNSGMNKGLVPEAESFSSNSVRSVWCDRRMAEDSKKGLETSKSSISKKEEHNCGDNLSTVIANSSSLQRVCHEQILYPNADEGNAYGGDGMNKGLVSEAESETKFSFSSNSLRSVRSDRQMATRLFSNFTLK